MKCLRFSRKSKPSLKSLRERCGGRADCLAEHGHLWGHEILETSCGGTPLYICAKCGDWSEHLARGLADLCKGKKANQARTSLNRVRNQGRHPLLKKDLDEAPHKYSYCESRHGPSRRTTAIRRITRRKLAGIVAWAEPEEAHVDPGGNGGDSDSGCPTAEEEARLHLEQEEYYANIDESPFSLGDEKHQR